MSQHTCWNCGSKVPRLPEDIARGQINTDAVVRGEAMPNPYDDVNSDDNAGSDGLIAYVRHADGSRTPITPKQWAHAVLDSFASKDPHGGDKIAAEPTDTGVIRADEGVVLDPGARYQILALAFDEKSPQHRVGEIVDCIDDEAAGEGIYSKPGYQVWFAGKGHTGTYVTAVRRVEAQPEPPAQSCAQCGHPKTSHHMERSGCMAEGCLCHRFEVCPVTEPIAPATPDSPINSAAVAVRCEPEQCHKYQTELIAQRDEAIAKVSELTAANERLNLTVHHRNTELSDCRAAWRQQEARLVESAKSLRLELSDSKKYASELTALVTAELEAARWAIASVKAALDSGSGCTMSWRCHVRDIVDACTTAIPNGPNDFGDDGPPAVGSPEPAPSGEGTS